ncbi:MAG TPA: DUF6152 family protein [Vicinamibacterales bacterium]|nr:DUF6152 family protein [Vicinamibacterales bacterium]
MRPSVVLGTAWLAMLFAAVPAAAQHTLAAKFDLTKPLTVTGTVTQIDWANPYVHVLLKVPGQPLPTLWAVEVEGPITLTDNGWSETSLAPGEEIRVEGFAARDGSHQVSGKSVTVTRTGRPVYVGTNGTPRARPVASGPTPRWPDGRPRLGPPPGQTGYWGYPTRTSLVEDGVNVQMDPYGLLNNIADAPKVAPLQPWALGIYRLRQSTFLQRDPMFLWCKPPGGPRQFQQSVGFQFVEQPDFKRVFVLLGGGNRNRRIIYTDAREHVGQIQGNDNNPLFYGHGVAHWEGDTFVVDMRGFNEEFWFDNGGLPHTEQLQMTERFTRVDMGTMRYEVTINDPGAYTRPWKSTWELKWVPGEETPYFLCQDNRP